MIALAITSQSQRAGFPLTWKIPTGVLARDSWVKLSQIRTLSTERLGERVNRVGEDDLTEMVNGLFELIG